MNGKLANNIATARITEKKNRGCACEENLSEERQT